MAPQSLESIIVFHMIVMLLFLQQKTNYRTSHDWNSFFFFFKAETSIMLVQQEAKSAPPGLEIWHHIQQGQTDTRGLTMHLSPPYSQPQGASASVREGVSVWGTHRRTNTLTSHGSHKPKKMSTHSFKLTPRHTVLSLTANLLTTMGQQAPFFVLFTERLQ